MQRVRTSAGVALLGLGVALSGCAFDETTAAATAEILDHEHEGDGPSIAALQEEVAALRTELDANTAAAADVEARLAAAEAAIGTPFPGPRTIKSRLEDLEGAGFLTQESDPVASAAGYLTTETDPVASAAGYLTEETDPVASAAGYLTTETDPVASAAGYLTTETDPVASAAGYMLATDVDIDNDPEGSATVTLTVTDAAPDVTQTTPWNVVGCRFLYLALDVDYEFTGSGTGTLDARVHVDQAVGQAGDVSVAISDEDDSGSATASTHVWLRRDTPSAATTDLGLDASATIEGTLTVEAKMLGCIE